MNKFKIDNKYILAVGIAFLISAAVTLIADQKSLSAALLPIGAAFIALGIVKKYGK